MFHTCLWLCIGHWTRAGESRFSLALAQRWPIAVLTLSQALMKKAKWGSDTPHFRAHKSFCLPLYSSRALFGKHTLLFVCVQQCVCVWWGGGVRLRWAARSVDVWNEWLSGFRTSRPSGVHEGLRNSFQTHFWSFPDGVYIKKERWQERDRQREGGIMMNTCICEHISPTVFFILPLSSSPINDELLKMLSKTLLQVKHSHQQCRRWYLPPKDN